MNREKDTIAEIKKLYPDAKIKIDSSLNSCKGIGDPKTLAEMKELLSKVKYPLPVK